MQAVFTANFEEKDVSNPLYEAHELFEDLNQNSTELSQLREDTSFQIGDSNVSLTINAVHLSLSGRGGVDLPDDANPKPVGTDQLADDGTDNDENDEGSQGRPTTMRMSANIFFDNDTLNVADEKQLADTVEDCLINVVTKGGGDGLGPFEDVLSAVEDNGDPIDPAKLKGDSISVARTNISGQAKLVVDARFDGSAQGPNAKIESILNTLNELVNDLGGLEPFINQECLNSSSPASVSKVSASSALKMYFGDASSVFASSNNANVEDFTKPQIDKSTINATVVIDLNKSDLGDFDRALKKSLEDMTGIGKIKNTAAAAGTVLEINGMEEKENGKTEVDVGIVVYRDMFQALIAKEALQREALVRRLVHTSGNVSADTDVQVSLRNVTLATANTESPSAATGTRATVPAVVSTGVLLLSLFLLAP